MARQDAVERWRKRAVDAESDRDQLVKLVRRLLNTNTGFKTWNKNKDSLTNFLELLK